MQTVSTTTHSGEGIPFDPFSIDNNPSTNNNKINSTGNQVGGNNLFSLNDIFGGSSNSSSVTNQIPGLDLFDLSGGKNTLNKEGIKSNTNQIGLFDNNLFGNQTPNTEGGSQPSTIQGTNDNNTNFNLFGNLNSSSGVNSTSSSSKNEMPVFSNSDINIICIQNKLSESALDVNYLVSNLTTFTLTNVKLTFLATKTVTVKVIQTSATNLDPNQANGIKKDISITNNDLTKPVVLKLKITYNIQGKEVNENITLNKFN